MMETAQHICRMSRGPCRHKETWRWKEEVAEAVRENKIKYRQEGQHPLTGQRTANFWLLANKWAARMSVMLWRHSCYAMRQSMCNTGASNAGRSFCVQISRERSYPLPIYWYHSKGDWLHYNIAADSFYIMKLCSRLFVLYCRNCPKDDNFRYFIPILRKLAAV